MNQLFKLCFKSDLFNYSISIKYILNDCVQNYVENLFVRVFVRKVLSSKSYFHLILLLKLKVILIPTFYCK